jgi:spore maturation protein CgeB
MMKVLLVSMKFDYGNKTRGLSGDYYYFESPLNELGMKVLSFDFMTVFQEQGQKRMNHSLLDLVCSEKPDLTIFVPYTDQFMPDVIDEINNHTTTLCYYFDDTWRIEYSAFWAKHFNYVTTSDVNGIKRWQDLGFNNFVYSPFGCNHRVFVNKNLPKVYDVSFVGGYHPYRAWCLQRLRNAGIDVHAWGHKWPNGRLSVGDMVEVFNQSRINLNFSNNESWDLRYVMSPMKPLRDTLSVIKNTLRTALRPDAKTREMVKARHFEINSCGGFQLSYYVEGLERHYQLGEEIALYESVDAIVDKVHYYLKNEDERETIARRGYERTLRDHGMEKRFVDLFDKIGIKNWRIN